MKIAGCLTAPQNVECRPKDKKLKYIEMDVAGSSAVHKDVLAVLRPFFELCPEPGTQTLQSREAFISTDWHQDCRLHQVLDGHLLPVNSLTYT